MKKLILIASITIVVLSQAKAQTICTVSAAGKSINLTAKDTSYLSSLGYTGITATIKQSRVIKNNGVADLILVLLEKRKVQQLLITKK